MHAAVGAKQSPGGTGELNKKSSLENVPPWGPGSNRLCGSGALRPSRIHSKGRHKGGVGASTSDHHLLSDLEASWSSGLAEKQHSESHLPVSFLFLPVFTVLSEESVPGYFPSVLPVLGPCTLRLFCYSANLQLLKQNRYTVWNA